jgi:ubiquinol-cytochrome c reductase cytochrome b subunit
LAQICTIFYFAFFLAMPIWSKMDKVKPVPDRVTMDGGVGVFKSLGILALMGVPHIHSIKGGGCRVRL